MKYCNRCGTKTIIKYGDEGYFDEKTGKRKLKKINFCPNTNEGDTYCHEHQMQVEDYFCPIKIKEGFHEYSHGFFGFLNPHCSGCGKDNSYMGG